MSNYQEAEYPEDDYEMEDVDEELHSRDLVASDSDVDEYDSAKKILNQVMMVPSYFVTSLFTFHENFQVLEQRVETLEREMDNAITTAARARAEKHQAEAGQKAVELRAQEVTRELENTTRASVKLEAA